MSISCKDCKHFRGNYECELFDLEKRPWYIKIIETLFAMVDPLSCNDYKECP
jgi:hypothetical protein